MGKKKEDMDDEMYVTLSLDDGDVITLGHPQYDQRRLQSFTGRTFLHLPWRWMISGRMD